MILNFIMFLAGLASVALGITVFVWESMSNIYDWGMIGSGIGMTLLSLMGCQLQKRPNWLACYLMIVVGTASFMLVVSCMFFANTGELVD